MHFLRRCCCEYPVVETIAVVVVVVATTDNDKLLFSCFAAFFVTQINDGHALAQNCLRPLSPEIEKKPLLNKLERFDKLQEKGTSFFRQLDRSKLELSKQLTKKFLALSDKLARFTHFKKKKQAMTDKLGHSTQLAFQDKLQQFTHLGKTPTLPEKQGHSTQLPK